MEKNRILIILALAFALILALSACSKTPSAQETDQQKPAASETEKESVKEVEKARETAETEETVEASAPAAEGAGSFELFGDIFTSDAESLKIARVAVWEDYCSEERREKALDELSRETLTFGEATMRIKVFIMGEEPVDGYPLYIAMHGGGYSETPDINNIQWEHMFDYYREYVVNGIYVAVRGVRDTWDTHFNPESFPIYDRLIQDMILAYHVNPNRVYLEGFSAGGDGVYGIVPRMADRFAAANMSAGHPNGISLMNLRNLPIQLQVGESDTAFDRNVETVNSDEQLNSLQKSFGGYEHRTYVHADRGHNFEDYSREEVEVMANPEAWRDSGNRTTIKVNSYAHDFLDQYTRNPLPGTVCWDLSVRADQRSVESFYYLKAPYSTRGGRIIASYELGGNHITLEIEDVDGSFSILLNEDMVDFNRPVRFDVNFGDAVYSCELNIEPDPEILLRTTEERGDPNFHFEAEITLDQLSETISLQN